MHQNISLSKSRYLFFYWCFSHFRHD